MAAVLLEPEQRFYVRELARRLGVSEGSLHRELTSLSAAGILKRLREGTRVFYQANTDLPIYPELRSILLKTVGLAEVLKEGLADLGGKVKVAFVYGSLAKGDETPDSDIDLMAIGEAAFGEVVDALGPAQERLAREVNPTVYPVKEFREKVQAGHHFVTTVLQGEKMFVTGDADGLERLAGKRLAD